jgi:large subunit ribosomal protein L21
LYGIIMIGGRQYKVSPGDILDVDRVDVEEGDEFETDKVLMVSDGEDIRIGRPWVEGAKARLRALRHIKGEKVIVFKYRPKKNYRRKRGHRQPLTRVVVEEIKIGG